MVRRIGNILRLLFFFVLLASFQAAGELSGKGTDLAETVPQSHPLIDLHATSHPEDSVCIRVATFLGNDKRNYYGDSAGCRLDVIWKTFLGKGTTIVNTKKGVEEWFGAGWTGQPLVVKEHNRTFLIQGAFDHHLKKIDAASGAVIWEYAYDDIIKGTATLWVNDSARDPQDRIVILQGSRKGVQNTMASPRAESFRAVSYFTGKELWRMNVEHTASYSRDVDASALIFNDTAYIGLENGKFVSFDPGHEVIPADTVDHPRIFSQDLLYTNADAARHGGNLVTESSPARIGNHIYITAGSGHVYGYDLLSKTIDWDYYIGSDMDGTPVVTSDSCLLVAVEKQYIEGNGGIFKLDPRKTPASCVEWYYPTGDFDFSSWKGGVIGSPAVNDFYNTGGMCPKMAAFTGIDGYLTVVRYDRVRSDTLVTGPDGKTKFPTPQLLFRKHTGPSISTPLFVQDKLIAAGYGGISVFTYDRAADFHETAFHPGTFEATPVADRGKIYVASRDGYLYCFGDTSNGNHILPARNIVTAVKKETTKPVVHPPLSVTATTVSKGKFYLVAGVFRVKGNADASMKQWKRQGRDATLLLSPANLYYVILGSSSSGAEADAENKKLREELGIDVWVYEGE